MRRCFFHTIVFVLALLVGVTSASGQSGNKKTKSKKTASTASSTHQCAPATSTTAGDQPGCGSHCGTERWPVKTVSDNDADQVSTTSEDATVSDLVLKRAPSSLPQDGRVAIEKTQVRVDALLIGRKSESDRDFHLVIADPANPATTMIAEIPNVNCTGACKSKFLQNFKDARKIIVNKLGQPTSRFTRLRTPLPVHIIGIPFFDFDHGQTGLAANCIEIHPVLSISFSGTSSPAHRKKGATKSSGGM